MAESAGQQQKRSQARPERARGTAGIGGTALPVLIALVGGGAVGLGLYAAADTNEGAAGRTDSPLLRQVAISDLDAAASTLAPERKDELMRRAKACEAPLFFIRLTKIAPAASGIVRIRSGAYTSPPFSLRDTPQLIAVPPPTEYKLGAGTMYLLGTASQVRFEFTPGLDLAKLAVEHVQPVWWYTNEPCRR